MQAYEKDGAPLPPMRLSSHQLAHDPPKLTGKVIDWPATARGIVEAIKHADSSWSEVPIYGDHLSENQTTLTDIPLLARTWESLAHIHIGRGTSIESVAALPRRSLSEFPEALLDLSVALECWWPQRESSPIWLARVEGGTLEDAAVALLREYIALDGHRLDDAWAGYLQRRYSWGAPKATLQELAEDAGVTRERIRQIEVRVSRLKGLRVWPLPAVLAEVIEAVQQSSFHDVPTTVLASGAATDDDWTSAELVELLEWYGQSAAASGLEERFQVAAEEEAEEQQDIRAVVPVIRAARNVMGLVPLLGVHREDGCELSREQVEKALRLTYRYVEVSGDWALASTEPSMLENATARQLGVTSPLSESELLVGLDRQRRLRQADPLPSAEVTLELLTSTGNFIRADGFVTGRVVVSDPLSVDGWLTGLLSEADGNVLHKEVINRSAIAAGFSLSSIGVYIQLHPCFRPAGDREGLIRLVGRYPTRDQEEHAIRVAEATRVPTDLAWWATSSGVDLELTLGSNVLTTGVLTPPRALAAIWPSEGAVIACSCGHASRGRVSVTKSGMVGLSTLIQHQLREHGAHEGASLRLRCSDSTLRAFPAT